MKRLLPFVFVIATLGCNVDGLDFDNVEGPTVNTSAAVPIGYAHYTIRELIDEIGDTGLDLQEDSTTLLYMIYRDTATFSTGSDIVDIPDVFHSAQIDLPAIPPVSQDTTIVVNQSFTFTYDAEEDELLDTLYYSRGILDLDLTSNTSNNFTYSVSINNTVEVANSAPVTFTDSQPGPIDDLNGYKTYLDRNTQGQNVFTVDFIINIPLAAGESIASGDFIAFDLSYTNQGFSLLYGKFGKDLIQVGNEVLNIELFENLGNSGLEFGNPTIAFEFQNGFGLPLGIRFDGLYSRKGTNVLNLSGSIAEDTLQGVLIAGATSPGTSASTTIEINRSNSNLVDLLNLAPEEIGFNVKAWTNPENSAASNFLEDDSQISTNIEVTLPMEVRLSDLTRKVSFDLGGGLNFDEADSMSIRVVTVNEIPLYVVMDMEILDENDSVLYTVANNAIISTPFLNIDGSLKEARKTIEDIPLSPEGIEAMNNGSKLVMETLLNSPKSRTGNDIYVKILADYKIDIQVSVVGTLKIDL